MRISSFVFIGLAAPALLITSACSTVPKTDSLMLGIDTSKTSMATSTMRAPDDPVCDRFYKNVAESILKVQKNKQGNAQMASGGISILTSIIGLGPLGSMATNTAAGVAIRQNSKDIRTAEFDPDRAFDRKIIEAAAEIKCPIAIKPTAP